MDSLLLIGDCSESYVSEVRMKDEGSENYAWSLSAGLELGQSEPLNMNPKFELEQLTGHQVTSYQAVRLR